tara:strand:+ start:32742 stop:33176 length:435 start_codon:yes stop_codon:yes gene_type:complete
MSSVNKVFLIGRLGQDPELKYLPNGSAVCSMSIATSESWNDKTSGEKKEKTEWHRINIWGKQGENANQYLQKGSQVCVIGKLQTRSWETDSGEKRYATEILAVEVTYLSAKSENTTTGNASAKTATTDYNVSSDANFASDDIPF